MYRVELKFQTRDTRLILNLEHIKQPQPFVLLLPLNMVPNFAMKDCPIKIFYYFGTF